jgi:hypothetical protein
MTTGGDTTTRHPPHLLQQVRDRIRRLYYSYRTEQTYVYWIRFFILFSGKRHPREMGKPEVERFLTHLATDRNVAASTQNQALSAILFLYKQVLEVEIDWIEDVVPAREGLHECHATLAWRVVRDQGAMSPACRWPRQDIATRSMGDPERRASGTPQPGKRRATRGRNDSPSPAGRALSRASAALSSLERE